MSELVKMSEEVGQDTPDMERARDAGVRGSKIRCSKWKQMGQSWWDQEILELEGARYA